MAKVKMVCPISGGLCVECGIYRGRHYFMCFSKEYGGRLGDITREAEETKLAVGGDDGRFGMPDTIHISSTCIQNPEDRLMEIHSRSQFIERREG